MNKISYMYNKASAKLVTFDVYNYLPSFTATSGADRVEPSTSTAQDADGVVV